VDTALRRKVLGQLGQGRAAEAKRIIELALPRTASDTERYWLNGRLAEILFDEQNEDVWIAIESRKPGRIGRPSGPSSTTAIARSLHAARHFNTVPLRWGTRGDD
jgi:hypothetical protein